MTSQDGNPLEPVLASYQITDPEQRAAVALAYEVTAEYTAPFITEVVAAMIDDLRSVVKEDPACRALFVGRDGHSLAIAARNLAPDFFAAHCSEAVMSRAVVDMALSDLEGNSDLRFPQVADFRLSTSWVDPDHINGARRHLSNYLESTGVRVGIPGSSVALVDTSFKGTVQELLAAAFPETLFRGFYVCFGPSPSDPHPGTKKGYAVHLDDTSNGRPLNFLPADPALTFAYQDAVAVLEYTLNGPLESPVRIGPDGPVQGRYRDGPVKAPGSGSTWGINPILIDSSFTGPGVREAAKDAMLLAVHDVSRQLGSQGRDAVRGRGSLIRDEIRRWVTRAPDRNPDFARVMDAFVARLDKAHVERTRAQILAQKLSPAQATEVWRRFDGLTLEAKKTFSVGAAEASPARRGLQGVFPAPTRAAPPNPTRPAGVPRHPPGPDPSRGPRPR